MIDALQLLAQIMAYAVAVAFGFVVAIGLLGGIVQALKDGREDHSTPLTRLHVDERDQMVKDPPVPHEPGVGIEDVHCDIHDRRN